MREKRIGIGWAYSPHQYSGEEQWGPGAPCSVDDCPRGLHPPALNVLLHRTDGECSNLIITIAEQLTKNRACKSTIAT